MVCPWWQERKKRTSLICVAAPSQSIRRQGQQACGEVLVGVLCLATARHKLETNTRVFYCMRDHLFTRSKEVRVHFSAVTILDGLQISIIPSALRTHYGVVYVSIGSTIKTDRIKNRSVFLQCVVLFLLINAIKGRLLSVCGAGYFSAYLIAVVVKLSRMCDTEGHYSVINRAPRFRSLFCLKLEGSFSDLFFGRKFGFYRSLFNVNLQLFEIRCLILHYTLSQCVSMNFICQ